MVGVGTSAPPRALGSPNDERGPGTLVIEDGTDHRVRIALVRGRLLHFSEHCVVVRLPAGQHGRTWRCDLINVHAYSCLDVQSFAWNRFGQPRWRRALFRGPTGDAFPSLELLVCIMESKRQRSDYSPFLAGQQGVDLDLQLLNVFFKV